MAKGIRCALLCGGVCEVASVIHHVFANKSNIGDWLTARGIQQLLGEVELTEHFCDAPFVTQTLEALAGATATDLIVVGGGGLFMDYFEPFWCGLLESVDETPICIWGVGYCDVKSCDSRPSTALLKAVSDKAEMCCVRDQLSHDYLGSCNLPDPVACPAMAVIPSTKTSFRGLIYADAYDNIGEANYQFVIDRLQQFAQRTDRPYRQTSNTIPAQDEAALNNVLSAYTASDLVVASRLHGCIVAVAMGKL